MFFCKILLVAVSIILLVLVKHIKTLKPYTRRLNDEEWKRCSWGYFLSNNIQIVVGVSICIVMVLLIVVGISTNQEEVDHETVSRTIESSI